MRHPSFRLIIVGSLLGMTLLIWSAFQLAMPSTETQQVERAWELAQDIGRYHYRTTVNQQIHPSERLDTVGHSTKRSQLSLEGSIDRTNDTMELTLAGYPGAPRPLSVKVEGQQAWGRSAPTASWQPIDLDTDLFAPGGDPLGFLSAAEQVQLMAHGDVAPSYRFKLNGDRYARYMRDQLSDQLREQGQLPPGIELDLSTLYQDMQGQGEIWLDERGLPSRLSLNLAFPPEKGSSHWVEADISTSFLHWSLPLAPTLREVWSHPELLASLISLTPRQLQDLGFSLGSMLLSLLGLVALVRYHRSRRAYALVALAVIVSLLGVPLMGADQALAFSALQQGQDQAAAEQQAAETLRSELRDGGFDPLANPLGAESQASAPASLATTYAATTTQQSTSYTTGSDSDGDGLHDDVELLKLGTDPGAADSDDDSILDSVEIAGFSKGGKTWYLDPNAADSNGDGLLDAVECSELEDVTTVGSLACSDRDSDGVPDVWDYDNDGDSVPDTVDSSPSYRAPLTTSSQESLQLKLEGYQTNTPLLVNFELRPTNPEHLWYVNHVLDWPSNDDEGQIRRVFDTTFLDLGTDGVKMDNGDLMLVPMLEITIPYSQTNTTGGLPMKPGFSGAATFSQASLEQWLDRDALDRYGISVNIGKSYDSLLVYVPVTTLNDEVGDTPVSLAAQMYYRPTNAAWGSTQQVKLVWLVNALVDTCDTTTMPAGTSYATWCDDRGNWVTSKTIIQTYYDSFYTTGLAVREDRGVQTALIGQVPGLNANYENYLWHLAASLQRPFLEAQQTTNNGPRFDISEIVTRFDKDSSVYANGAGERWGIPKAALEASLYNAADETSAFSDLIGTHIPSFFSTLYQNTTPANGAMATLLLVREQRNKSTILQDSSNVMVSSSTVTFRLNGVSEQVTGSLSWSPYRYNSSSQTWEGSDLSTALDYWEAGLGNALGGAQLAALLATLGDTVDNTALSRQGALSLAESFYTILYSGMVGLLTVSGTSVGTATLNNSTYALGSSEALVLIVADGLRLLHTFFVNELAITLDGATVGSAMSSELSDATRVLETAGALRAELDDYSAPLYDITSEATSAAVKKVFKIIYKRLAKISKLNSTVGSKSGTVGTAMSLSPAALVIAYELGLDKSDALELTVAALVVAGEVLNVGKMLEAYARAFKLTSMKTFGAVKNVIAAQDVARLTKASMIFSLALDIGVAVGLFIYSVGANGIDAGSLAFTALLAETIAGIIVAIIMAALSATLVGALVVALIGLIDAVIALICDAQNVEEDSTVDTWVCGGITGALTQAIAYTIFDQTPFVDLKANRLETALQEPGITQRTAAPGFVVGNEISIGMVITSSLHMNSPTSLGNSYWHQFNNDNLDDTRIDYRLQASATDFTATTRDWIRLNSNKDPRFYHVYTPAMRATLSQAGVNQSVETYFSESVKSDVQECWLIWVPPSPIAVPVCYIRDGEFEVASHTSLSETFVYDVLPATLDGFSSLASAGNGGYRLDWDDQFPTLRDADGDGLASPVYAGPDPDDSTWDYDGDGLSDYWEYNNGYDLNAKDGDGDGLSDYWEELKGTDPYKADSDSDGLKDGEEYFHPNADHAYANSSTGWSGGWTIVYGYSGATALKTLVSADPTMADTDDDSILDKQESIYGYNPNVYSTLNVLSISSEMATRGSSIPGHIRLGQTVSYTATVSNELDNRYASGLFEVELPPDVRRSQGVLETLAPREAVTTTGSLVVDSSIISTSTVTSLTLRAGAEIQDLETGRVLWLHLNDSAAPYSDSSLRGHPATCTGSTCPIANKASADFDGGDHLTVAHSSDFNLSAQTVSLWARRDTLGTQTLLTKGTSGITLAINGTGRPTARLYLSDCSTAVTATSTTQMVSSTWYNLVATYDGATLRLYLSGVLVDSQAAGSICGSNTTSITIGTGFNGMLDEIEIYDSALPYDAITDLFKKPVFNLTTPNVNSSDYGAVLLACGSTSYNDCPMQTTGVTDKGFQFNQDNYLTVYGLNSQDLVTNDSTFSMAMWVYPENSYAPDNQHFTTHGQVLIGNIENGYNKAPPSLFLKGQNLIVRFGVEPGTSYCEATSTGNQLAYNKWQHIAVTYDGASFTLYKDGVATGVSWSTNGNCQNVAAYQVSNYSLAGTLWWYYIGSGLTPAIKYSSLNPISGANDDSAYLWNNTTDLRIWDSGDRAVDSSSMTLNNVWATTAGPTRGDSALTFSFCNRDGQTWTSDCSGQNSVMFYGTSGSSAIYRTKTFNYYDAGSAHSVQYYDQGGDFNAKLNYSVYNSGFKGKLDDIALYRSALDADDIEGVYKGTTLALELKFDEASGQGLFADSSGNDYTVSCDAGAGTCPASGLSGRNNQALTFDGSNDRLRLAPTTTNLGIYDSSFTVMAWIKGDAFGNKDRAILGVNTDTTNNAAHRGLHLVVRNGKPYMGFWNNDTAGATTLSPSRWYHLAFVYDKAALTQKIYVNGVLDATGSNKSAYQGASQALYAGYSYFSDIAFDGAIDDLKVARVALSQSQIQAAMKQAPALNLHLDEDYPATTFVDETANANNAVCSAAACPAAGSKGQMRETPVFDGGDTLTIASAGSALNLSNNFSVALWVKPATTRNSAQTLLRKHNGSGGAVNYNLWMKANSLAFKFDLHPASSCSSSGVRHVDSQAGGGALNKDQWNHIVATYDANRLTLYLNGQLVASENHNTPAGTVVPACTTGGTIDIGQNFAGSIDEVTVYDSLLSDGEVEALYDYQAGWYDVISRHHLVVDADAPELDLSVEPGASIKADPNLVLAISARDRTTNVVAVQYRVGTSGAWLNPTRDGSSWIFTLTPGGEVQHTVQISATDSVGNLGSLSRTFTIDNTAPSASLDSGLGGTVLRGTGSVTLSGQLADAGSGINPERTTVELVDQRGSSLSGAEVAEVSGQSWSLSYPLAQPAYGAYDVHVARADLAGNVITGTIATVELDGHGPVADLTMATSVLAQSGALLQGTVNDVPYPQAGRLLQLHFEEDAGSTSFVDGGRHHFTASCSGGACPSAEENGYHNSALSFDGLDDGLSIAHEDALAFSGGTISAWINPASLGGIRRIVATGQSSSADGFGFGMSGNRLLLSAFGVNEYLSSATISANSWQHVAVILDDDDDATFYLNGQQIDTVEGSAALEPNADDPLYIGRGASPTEPFAGLLDEVTIYDHALSDEAIYRIAHPLPTTVSSLMLRFRHAEQQDQGEQAGFWHRATLGSPNSTSSTWSYSLSQPLEGPYKIDLKATDSLGNSSYIPNAWTGEIDTRAPRVDLTFEPDFSGDAEIQCYAADYNLTTDGWSCPVTDTTLVTTTQDAAWFVEIFSPTLKLATIDSAVETMTASDATMTACDLYSQCTTRTSSGEPPNGDRTPGGLTPTLDLWLKADAGTDTATNGAAVTFWDDYAGHDGFTAMQLTGAAQPSYQTGAVNGNPSLSFGGDDTITLDNKPLLETSSATLLAVIKPAWTAGSNGYDPAIMAMRDETGTRWSWHLSDDYSAMELSNGSSVGSVSMIMSANTWHLVALVMENGSWTGYLDGVALGTVSQPFNTTTGLPLNIASSTGSAEWFNGQISELMIAGRALSGEELAQVESYLALKYGVTLGGAQPYLSSERELLWNGADGQDDYHNDVAGIGRDDRATLYQPQSRSLSGDDLLTIAASNLGEDRSFLLWGNDNGALAVVETGIDALSYYRLARTWRVQSIGPTGTVSVSFDLAGQSIAWSPGSLALLTDSDADFSDASLITSNRSVVGSVVTFSNVSLSPGTYLTLVTGRKSPGGISSNLRFWLRAGAGTNTTSGGGAVSSWADQSGSGYDVSQSMYGRRPTYRRGVYNGNPALRFDSGDYLSRSILGSDLFAGDQNTLFFVQKSNSGMVWFNWQTSAANRVGFELSSNRVRFDTPNDSGGTLVGSTAINSGLHLVTGLKSSTDQTIYVDGAQDATQPNSSILSTGSTANLIIGKHQNGFYSWQGDMAEAIVYNGALDQAARQRVESYLGLKYGLTLGHSYLDSAGVTIWDRNALDDYHHDVAGIGRDDLSALAQYRSTSNSSDDVVTIANGTSISSPAPLTADRSFLLWGNDNASAKTVTPLDGDFSRLLRVWRVQKTGTVGQVSVKFDLTGLGISIDSSKVALLISNSPDFMSPTQHTAGRSVSGSVVSFTNVSLSSGQYFTLLTNSKAPGGVAGDLKLWLRADSGTSSTTNGGSVSQWSDQSGNAQHLTQPAVANQPLYLAAALNGRPAVKFDSTDSLSRTLQGSSLFGGSAATIFFVKQSTSVSGAWFNWQTANTNRVGFELSSSKVRFDIPNDGGGQLIGATSVLNGLHIVSAVKSATSETLYVDGQQDATRANASSLNTSLAADLLLGKGVSGALGWEGFIGEVIIYNRALSVDERKQVENYLSYKYGQSLSGPNAPQIAVQATSVGPEPVDEARYEDLITDLGPRSEPAGLLAAEQIAQTAQTMTLSEPPTGLAITNLLANGQPLSLNRTVDGVQNPTLTVEWSPASAETGIASYQVTWRNQQPNGTLAVVRSVTLSSSATSDSYAAGEAQQLWVEVSAVDGEGNVATVSDGPIFVDYTTTPAYIPLDGSVYSGWLDNSCNLLGVDTRITGASSQAAQLEEAQRFYLTWDSASLQLAWSGADWRGDGDLFIYLDTVGGAGSSQAYNPYGDDSTAIFLPVTGGSPMGADYLFWVRETGEVNASLLAWNDAGQTWAEVRAPWLYQFDGDQVVPFTSIALPWDSIGITSPSTQQLGLIALASAEGSLDIWATMPVNNSLNSAQIAGDLVLDEVQTFILSRPFAWDTLSSGFCPSGVDNSGQRYPQAQSNTILFNNADLSAELSSDPAGVSYGLFRHHVIFAQPKLFPNSADWSGAQSELCQQTPPPGSPAPPECQRDADDGRGNGDQLNHHTEMERIFGIDHGAVRNTQTINYTLRISNSGDQRADGVTVELTASALVRLPAGQLIQPPQGPQVYRQTISLGTLEAGETRLVSFSGVVDTSFNPPPVPDWTRLKAIIYDETGNPDRPSEELHLDHEVDSTMPAYIEVQSPRQLIGSGQQTIAGFVSDQSTVPTITLELDGQQTTCGDPTPADGQWSCPVDLGSRGDGEQISVRLKATDSHGYQSDWINAAPLVVDVAMPTLSISSVTSDTLADGVLGPAELVLSGSANDNHVVSRVEVCDASTGSEICSPAMLTLDEATLPQLSYSYADQPADPLAFGAANGCQDGTMLARTFTVSDTFTVADLDVGVIIAHPFRNDVAVKLRSPLGTEVDLVSHSSGAENVNVWLDDSAPMSIFLEEDLADHTLDGDAYQNQRSPYNGLLAQFRGQQAQGTWQMLICDSYPQSDDGLYLRSELRMQAAEAPGATSGSWSYQLNLPANLEQPAYALRIYAYDQSGNRSDALALNFEVDTQAPRLAITTMEGAVGGFRLAGSVSDRNDVAMRLAIRAPSGTLSADTMLELNQSWSYTSTMQFQREGIYCLWVEAEDSSQNRVVAGPVALQATASTYHTYLPLAMQTTASTYHTYLPLAMLDSVPSQLLTLSPPLSMSDNNDLSQSGRTGLLYNFIDASSCH